MKRLPLIQSKIYEIRGQKVMLDFDLAKLYQVETRVLNQSVKRNIERFPEDFMFQLSKEEWENISKQKTKIGFTFGIHRTRCSNAVKCT